jgi:hypothetical protein
LSWTAQTLALMLLSALAIYGFVDDDHPFFWLALVTPLLAALHLPGRPWQGPVGRGLLVTFALTSATHAVFFGDDRYHLVVSPLLCILAAAALRAGSGQHQTEPAARSLAGPSRTGDAASQPSGL